jgi:glycine betaine/choline ABC-type transport system substrate-binding protein
MAVLKRPPATDPTTVLADVRAAYESQWKLAWLAPLGFENTFAMIVRGETARDGKLTSLSDAARGGPWHFGVGYEFAQRADGLPGLLKAYGLRSSGDPVTMDLGLLYSALNSRKVDMIAANSTDGPASALDVKILDDDKHYFPPYQCAVVVREESLARYPGLRGALEQLSGKLSVETMRRLNQAVDGDRRPIPQVATEFLNSVK